MSEDPLVSVLKELREQGNCVFAPEPPSLEGSQILMQGDALAPCSHGSMWSEEGHLCYLLMSRQTQPELFVQRNFPKCGPHISGRYAR